MEFHGDSWPELYVQVRHKLLQAPIARPRGTLTRELVDVNMVLESPRMRLGFHQHRKYNLPFALSEATMLFAPTRLCEYICHFNQNMLQFSDDGVHMRGAYGWRIALYLNEIVEKLKADPDTRQAVLDIHALHDLDVASKDIPCTLSLQFLIRERKLHMITYMRSNDLFWGTAYDIVMFSVLQEVIANTLGIEMGTYSHHASSLHVYDHHFQLLNDIQSMMPVEFSVPYTVNDMQRVVFYYMELVHGNAYDPSQYGPFAEIFYRSELATRGEQIPPLPQGCEFAYDFIAKRFGYVH